VMWTRLVWLRIGTDEELFWIRYWTLGFHKMLGNYRVSKQQGISWVVLSSILLVSFKINTFYVFPVYESFSSRYYIFTKLNNTFLTQYLFNHPVSLVFILLSRLLPSVMQLYLNFVSTITFKSRDSIVCTATDYGLGDRGSEFESH
jgi:hypothetical protein